MEALNKFELAILERLSVSYPLIKSHIPFLRVRSRESTGIGMYINFYYTNDISLHLELVNTSISTNETIEISELKYGLSYEVDITNGKINFIELVTYGEEWNGSITNYEFN